MLGYLEMNPIFDPLRSERRFMRLEKQVGLEQPAAARAPSAWDRPMRPLPVPASILVAVLSSSRCRARLKTLPPIPSARSTARGRARTPRTTRPSPRRSSPTT
jgi:hypothetical protein